MSDADLDFANDARAAVENAVTPGAWRVVVTVGALMAAGVAWAGWAEVDLITTGIGRVIPSSQVQVVQSLEPGLVAEIMVREGDSVTAGQSLVRIDDTGVAARLGELSKQRVSLQAELERLAAQARSARSWAVPAGLEPAAAAAYRDQHAVFLADRRRLDEQASIRRQQLVQRRQALAEAEATARKQAETLALTERELELTEALFRKKAVPEIEFLRIQRAAAELRGDLDIWQASKIRLEAEVAESEALLASEETAFLAEVEARVSRANTELSVVEESLRAADDRVRRAVLRAPVGGVVNNLAVATIGEVISAGANVVEIVPADDRLLVETRIRPQDVAFIRPGSKATIRLTAYDYTRYGTLSGTVERIGADTITDENRETFYQVIVGTDGGHSAGASAEMRVIPGMVATVDISNGQRTVLEYLMKPILRIRDQALREAK